MTIARLSAQCKAELAEHPAENDPLFTPEFRKKIIKLASQYSVVEISRLRGFPAAATLYRELASNLSFERDFRKAANNCRLLRRAELADLIRRSRNSDLSRVLIELRKIKHLSNRPAEQNNAGYDFTGLNDSELEQLEALLSKSSPQTGQGS